MIEYQCRADDGTLSAPWRNFCDYVSTMWLERCPTEDYVIYGAADKQYSNFFDKLLAEYGAVDVPDSNHILFDNEQTQMIFVLRWS